RAEADLNSKEDLLTTPTDFVTRTINVQWVGHCRRSRLSGHCRILDKSITCLFSECRAFRSRLAPPFAIHFPPYGCALTVSEPIWNDLRNSNRTRSFARVRPNSTYQLAVAISIVLATTLSICHRG